MAASATVRVVRHALAFLRLTDETGKVSLTNLGMLLALYLMAHAVRPGFGELTAFFLALATYQTKKVLAHVATRAAAADVNEEHTAALAGLTEKFNKLAERAQQQDNGKAMAAALSAKGTR